VAVAAQGRDRVEGHHAIGAAAIGDDLLPRRQVTQPSGQVGDRDRHGARDVAGPVLLTGPHVQHDHGSRAHPREQLLAAHRLEIVPGTQMTPDQPLHVAEPALGDRSQHPDEVEHLGVRETVLHEQPLLAALDEPGLPQDLQVPGGVRHGEGRLSGQ
jgi:hypothetical protein